MGTISKVQPQDRTPRRYNIYLDGEYAFSVTEEVLVRFSLLKGRELSSEEINQVQQAELAESVQSKAYYYLSFRPRTKRELLNYLQGKGYDGVLAEEAVSELEKKGWVDDREFANQFTTEKVKKGYGTLYISQGLAQRGVDSSIIREALADVSHENWREAVFQLLHKKSPSYARLSNRERMGKMCQLLLRRGYVSYQVYDWVREYLADEGQRIDFPSFEE